MESPLPLPCFSMRFNKFVCLAAAAAVFAGSGCSGVAPSKTASGAGTGALVGAGAGAVVGNNSSMGSGAGILGGAALGAITGGIIGMVQEAKDRKEQDRLSQERAYQQELAKKRSEEAKRKAAEDEELAIAQGFRISDLELNDAQKKTEDTATRLKNLQNEKAAALQKKKTLDDLHEKQLSNEAEIARLEEELARLKSDDPNTRPASASSKKPDPAPSAPAPSAAVKPGP
jgi:flagellar biosynthesis GTPase FlhF